MIIEIDCSMWIVNRNGDVCGIDEIELNDIFVQCEDNEYSSSSK